MIPFTLKALTIPISFHNLPKRWAIVDADNAQTEERLAEISVGNHCIEIARDPKRDVNEDANVGAHIVLVDAERIAGARELTSAVRSPGFRTPLPVLANSQRLANLAVVDGPVGLQNGWTSPAVGTCDFRLELRRRRATGTRAQRECVLR